MDHLKHAQLATATLMDIISRTQAIQAAILRGAEQQEIAVMRSEVHDTLDAYLDHSVAAMQAAKSILS